MKLNSLNTNFNKTAFKSNGTSMTNYGASDGFVSEMQEAQSLIPDNVLGRMQETRRTDIRLAPTVTMALLDRPDLVNQFAREIIPRFNLPAPIALNGVSIDNQDGTGTIVLCEDPPLNTGATAKDFASLVLKEVSKGIEASTGDNFSNSPEFRQALAGDLRQLGNRQQEFPQLADQYEETIPDHLKREGVSRMSFLLQGSTTDNIKLAGARNVLAQSGAELITSKPDAPKFMGTFFPRSCEEAQKFIASV